MQNTPLAKILEITLVFKISNFAMTTSITKPMSHLDSGSNHYEIKCTICRVTHGLR